MNAIDKKAIKKYVKERDAMLKKCSISELRKFVEEHKQFYSPEFVEAIGAAGDDVLRVTLHKMIVHAVNLPREMRRLSADWLTDNGYSVDIR